MKYKIRGIGGDCNNGYYITDSEKSSTQYMHKDSGLFHPSCGSENFFKTKEEAEECLIKYGYMTKNKFGFPDDYPQPPELPRGKKYIDRGWGWRCDRRCEIVIASKNKNGWGNPVSQAGTAGLSFMYYLEVVDEPIEKMKEKTIAQQLNITKFPFIIKDDNGWETYYESSKGNWSRHEYDTKGNITYYENSRPYWVKTEYDAEGKQTYYENSRGDIVDDRSPITSKMNDDIEVVKKFINESTKAQEECYNTLTKEINLTEHGNDWLFDYIYNDGLSYDSWEGYLKNYNMKPDNLFK